jgi:hypothetical protein
MKAIGREKGVPPFTHQSSTLTLNTAAALITVPLQYIIIIHFFWKSQVICTKIHMNSVRCRESGLPNPSSPLFSPLLSSLRVVRTATEFFNIPRKRWLVIRQKTNLSRKYSWMLNLIALSIRYASFEKSPP